MEEQQADEVRGWPRTTSLTNADGLSSAATLGSVSSVGHKHLFATYRAFLYLACLWITLRRCLRNKLYGIKRALRLTLTAILRAARLSWAIHKLDRLPTTAAMLATIAESRIDFACRRIRIVAADWNPENAPIPGWRLIRTANLRSDLLKHREVVDAITNAISSLNARSPGLKSVEHQVALIQGTTDPTQEELPSASSAEFPPSVLNCMRNGRTALDVDNSNITCRQ
jgi:hypothetical protein